MKTNNAHPTLPCLFCTAASKEAPSQTLLSGSPPLKYSIQNKFDWFARATSASAKLNTWFKICARLKIYQIDLPGSRCPHFDRAGGRGPLTEKVASVRTFLRLCFQEYTQTNLLKSIYGLVYKQFNLHTCCNSACWEMKQSRAGIWSGPKMETRRRSILASQHPSIPEF